MRPTDPFVPFLQHEDIRDRQVMVTNPSATVDDFLDAPDRAAMRHRFAFPRLRTFALVASLVASAFALRLFQLQIVSGAWYRDQAENNRVKREVILAPRGVLTDRFNQPLTTNEPAFYVTLTPNELPADPDRREQLLNAISGELSLPRASLDDQLRQLDAHGRRVLETDIIHDQAIRLLVRFARTPGVLVSLGGRRSYPLGVAAAHLIGYTSKPTSDEVRAGTPAIDSVGRTGLELQYQTTLAGVNGVREIERDSTNREQRVIATERPRPGKNIKLTIDAQLQAQLSDALDRMVQQTRSPGGAAVAIDPRNGEILALVSAPGFDTNALTRGLSPAAYEALISDPHLPLFNRAIAGEFPSGSTIKPFVAATALEEKILSAQTNILSTGGITVGQWFFPDWKAGGHGSVNVTQAIAESVNTFFYTIGGGTDSFRGLGIERMTAGVRRFGFGQTTQVDLPGEKSGFLPSKDWKERTKGERWYIGDTYHFAIGQGDLLVTPLQLANGVAAIANGGTLYRPHLVLAVSDAAHTVLQAVAPEVVERTVASGQNLATIRQGMREAVVSGSVRALANLPVPAAGKTGTAEFGSAGKTHSWFTAFAPYDQPTIALAVIVEGGGEGHLAALPVAQTMLSWYFTRRQP